MKTLHDLLLSAMVGLSAPPAEIRLSRRRWLELVENLVPLYNMPSALKEADEWTFDALLAHLGEATDLSGVPVVQDRDGVSDTEGAIFVGLADVTCLHTEYQGALEIIRYDDGHTIAELQIRCMACKGRFGVKNLPYEMGTDWASQSQEGLIHLPLAPVSDHLPLVPIEAILKGHHLRIVEF